MAWRTSPTFQRVELPPSLRGFGSLPSFAQRQIVVPDVWKSAAKVADWTNALSGSASNVISAGSSVLVAMRIPFQESPPHVGAVHGVYSCCRLNRCNSETRENARINSRPFSRAMPPSIANLLTVDAHVLAIHICKECERRMFGLGKVAV